MHQGLLYGKSVDLWSYGMILVMLVQKDSPFKIYRNDSGFRLLKMEIMNANPILKPVVRKRADFTFDLI